MNRLSKLNSILLLFNGGKNSGNHNPGQGRGRGKPGGGSYLSSQAKNLTWNEYKSQMRDEKFRKTAVDAGLKSYDDLWQVWAKAKNDDFTISNTKELSKEQTVETIRKNLDDLNPDMWFVNADSNYKPRIVNRILERKELRNAGLNLAYQNYKDVNDDALSFNDFLNTEMKMYRGHRGQKTIESDWFDSYTPKREFAELFGNKIKTISIKPKDTLGSYTTNAESEYLVLTKLKQENSIQFNGGPGSGNHNPGQGRGVGKPNGGSGGRSSRSGKGSSKSSGDSTVFRVGDDITFTKDGKTYEGMLEYKDGHWYLLRDKSEGGLMEITVDDVRRSKRVKTAAQKEKERKLEQLGEQGIRHKTPKERQTPRQREIIHSLDNMGVLSPDMQKWLLNYGDEEVLGHIEYELSRAEAMGLKLSRVNLERLRTGSSTWGKAFYSGKFAFVGQMLDGNPMKIQQIEKDSNKFHAEDSVKAVVKHEIGHLISYQIGRQFTTGSFSDKTKTNTYCNHLVRDVAGKDFWHLTENEISRYGMENVRECIAESWSNPDYSEFTKKIATQMEKDLDDTRDLQTFNMLSRQQEEDEDELCSGYGPEFEEGVTIEVESEDRKERLNYLKLQFNGGKNSGNHNPGQGRGIGKPNGGGARLSKSTKSFEEYVNKTHKWMPTPERFYAIADSLGYTGEPKVVNNKEFEKTKESGDYIPMFRGFRGDIYTGITAIEAVEDFLYGDYYAGNGQSRFGDGIYLAGEEGYATHYSEDISDTQSAVLRMLVPKGKYIEIKQDGDFRDKKQQEKFEKYYQMKSDECSAKAEEAHQRAKKFFDSGDSEAGEKAYEEMENFEDLSNAYSDLKYAQTEYAMMQGYDGIHWDAAQDDDALKEEYVVFDRSKIIVQKPDFL